MNLKLKCNFPYKSKYCLLDSKGCREQKGNLSVYGPQQQWPKKTTCHKTKKETTKMPGKGRGYHFSQIQLSLWYTSKLYSLENKAKFCKRKATGGVFLETASRAGTHIYVFLKNPPNSEYMPENICSEYMLWEHKRGGNTYVQQFLLAKPFTSLSKTKHLHLHEAQMFVMTREWEMHREMDCNSKPYPARWKVQLSLLFCL